jgi:hypothetical protein
MQQRRGHRIMLAIPILIAGAREDGRHFSEKTRALVVSSHGALILLAEKVNPGQSLTIQHAKSGEQRECTIVDVGEQHGIRREVGIELLDPSARFWHVAFPPENWSPHSPEAKRTGAARSLLLKSGPTR